MARLGHVAMLALLLRLAAGTAVAREGETGSALVRREVASSDVEVSSEELLEPSAEAATEEQKADASAIELAPSALAQAPKASTLRPNAGGPADEVEFRVLLKKFMGLEFKANTWQGEFVVITSWKDARAVAMAASKAEASFSKADAEAEMWIPDISITNREFDKISTVASTVHVKASGSVTMTERIVATMLSPFDSSQFPFDRQRLVMRLSSTSLMSQDLVFKEATIKSDVMKSAFPTSGGWQLVPGQSSFATTIKEIDGPLKKSRVEFGIDVSRDSSSFFASTMFPQYLMILGAYSVFYYPMIPVYAMPRVAIVTIGNLALLSLQQKTIGMMPASGGTSWINVFEESAMLTVGFTTVANILIENCDHTYQMKPLAQATNVLGRILFAVLFISTMLFQVVGYYWIGSLTAMIWLQRLFVLALSAALIVITVKKKNAPPAAEGDAAASGEGGEAKAAEAPPPAN
eukprot:TRINITY_DN14300_c0_g8_i1.p1 TRINITY_DN14300_c0_g8~~TRINITY_DN14300_c0_g8_i1.p1  ORF type:complete len:495 (+),score=123.50 TRINITY_DN14300_c0_g8_i1:94-1485(+)